MIAAILKNLLAGLGRGRADSAREIFAFFDGSGQKSVDPIKALRDLERHETFKIADDPLLAQTGDHDGIDRTLAAIREAFGVEPFCPATAGRPAKGLTEGETLALLDEFGYWVDDLKKNGDPSPTGAPATEPPPSTTSPADDSPGESATSDPSDSG